MLEAIFETIYPIQNNLTSRMLWDRENHQITLPAQGGAAGCVRLLLKTPTVPSGTVLELNGSRSPCRQ